MTMLGLGLPLETMRAMVEQLRTLENWSQAWCCLGEGRGCFWAEEEVWERKTSLGHLNKLVACLNHPQDPHFLLSLGSRVVSSVGLGQGGESCSKNSAIVQTRCLVRPSRISTTVTFAFLASCHGVGPLVGCDLCQPLVDPSLLSR